MADRSGLRRPVGRPAQISRQRILEAVASSENMDTVTMRDLAARLGVSHAALYRWVPDRHALFDLVTDELLGRVLDEDGPLPEAWPARLEALALRMHERYLAVPGFATHLARPHVHSPGSLDRLRGVVVAGFLDAGVSEDAAEQSWTAYITAVVAWIALEESTSRPSAADPRFERFVGVLLRGLPVEG